MSNAHSPSRAAAYAGFDQWEASEPGAAWSLVLDAAEPVFAGHYPHEPILPGVYVFESLCQGIEHWFARQGYRAAVESVRSMRFLLPFRPGHRMSIEAVLPAAAPGSHAISAVIYRNGEKAGTARVSFHVQEKSSV